MTIPDGVATIDEVVFWGCNALTRVTIGKGVTSIKRSAFEGCRNIQSLYCYAETPPAMPDNDPFDSTVKENAILYVPTGCKSKYEAAACWSGFLNIQEMTLSDKAQSNIEDTIAEEVTVTVQNGTIVVNGLEKPVSIEVYSLNGQLLYRGTETTIPITEQGIYIARILDKSFKVVDVSK